MTVASKSGKGRDWIPRISDPDSQENYSRKNNNHMKRKQSLTNLIKYLKTLRYKLMILKWEVQPESLKWKSSLFLNLCLFHPKSGVGILNHCSFRQSQSTSVRGQEDKIEHVFPQCLSHFIRAESWSHLPPGRRGNTLATLLIHKIRWNEARKCPPMHGYRSRQEEVLNLAWKQQEATAQCGRRTEAKE